MIKYTNKKKYIFIH